MVVWRRLAALCVLVLTPVAVLAADVSVYGSANVELGSYREKVPEAEKDPDFKSTRLEDNTRGRFGIKAAEDLGGGVSSFARFEWEVSTVTNSAANASADADEEASPSLTQRMSYVGIASKFGSILAGNLKSPYKYTGGVKYDPFVATALEARGNGGMTGGALGHEDFLEKMVSYELPKGTLSGRVAYGVEQDDGALSLDLLFKLGGWEAFAAYIDASDRELPGVVTGLEGYQAVKVGGQFRSESGAHQISAQYEYIEKRVAGESTNPAVWFLGYQFKYDKATLAAQVGQSDGDAYSDPAEKTDYAALGAIYRFSRETRIYTGYRYTKDVEDVFTIGLRKDFKS